MKITIFGLSITSSWGNGHATTYRSLVRALSARGHDVLFLERDLPWYAGYRDLPSPRYCRTRIYQDLERRASPLCGRPPRGRSRHRRILCARGGTLGICVILMTGFDLEGFQRRAAEAGIFRALLKPCLPDAMLREVYRALRLSPARRGRGVHSLPASC